MNNPDSDALPAWTSAGALHEILDSLLNLGELNLVPAWSQVLEAEWGTLEFSRRHSEVVCLWTNAISEIEALNSERSRERILRYAHSWWTAIVGPRVAWESNTHSTEVINRANLDQLATAADLITVQLHGVSATSATTGLSEFRAECAEWIEFLETTDEIADEALRRTLQAQIAHLIWLIDNAGRFGIARIVQNGDQVSGTLVRAMTVPEGKIKNPGTFGVRVKKLVAALAILSGFISNSKTIIEAARDSVPAIENVVHEITDLDVPPSASDGPVIS